MALVSLWIALAFSTATIFVADAWAVSAFQALACLTLVFGRVRSRPWILALPAFGLLQLAIGSTIYPHATMQAVLHWLSLATVFLVTREAPQDRASKFLDAFVGFAGLEAVLCLAQLHTSNGQVLWFIPTGYDDYVYGTFTSYNNFAQFAELAIPVAIVRGFEDRRSAWWHILAAGLLYAAVIASTSRSGALIATGELLVLPLFLAWRGKRAWRQAAWTLALIPMLAVLWTAAAGWDRLIQRFEAGDLAAGRREFLQSAVDMAADKPLLGHGLGTFPIGYPRYARIDLPEFVNHAHNDWAEFAADGGFVFALAVLALFVWASRKLPANPWAFGIVAVVIHAAVDYPFARPGVAGWMFALLGILVGSENEAFEWRWFVPATAVAGLAAATWFCAANVVFLRDTPEWIARAASMDPGNADYWLRLSQRSEAPDALARALSLNPRNARILIAAGLQAESAGDPALAESLLIDAAKVDRGWLPRWTLANFHLRREAYEQFWRWGRDAASVSSGFDLLPLFRLASNIESDPEQVATRLLPDRPEPLRAYIKFLIHSNPNENRSLGSVSRRLLQCGAAIPDRNYVLAAVERFIEQKQAEPAQALWQAMLDQGWLPPSTGQTFASAPLGEGFDWRMFPVEGIVVSPAPGQMTLSFSGKQPESWAALQRVAPVEPHQRYRLRLRYSTEGVVAPASGMRWRVVDEVSGQELTRGPPLEAAETSPREATVEFQAAGAGLVRLQFLCEREPGATRTNGSIHLCAAELLRAL